MTVAEPDRLSALAALLASLEDQPVAAHPAALEEVHRGLVGELDALAVASAAGAGPAARS